MRPRVPAPSCPACASISRIVSLPRLRDTCIPTLVALAATLPAAPAAAHVLPPTDGITWLAGHAPAFGSPAIGGAAAGVRPGAESTGAPTPRAYGDCGPEALPETGLQGQVPRADQDSGRSRSGYRCNLRLVGRNDIQARGANFQLGYYGDCAYVGIVGNQLFQSGASDPPHPLEGVAVIDAADPARPQLSTILQSPKGRTQHEALEVNQQRGMLVVAIGGLQAQWIEIYDVSGDCRRPVFKGRYDAGRPLFHGLRVSDDGRTVYVSDNYGVSGSLRGEVLHVLDVTDMTAPRLLTTWDPTEHGSQPYGVHDLELSEDGRRAYIGAQPYSSSGGIVLAGPPSNDGPSVVVLDTTDVQLRRPDPVIRVVGEAALPNFGHAIQRARIGGRPYLFASGESVGARGENCPWAWGHILDMSDEQRPRAVSEIKLEVNEQANCERLREDGAVYSIHYVGVDDEQRTTRVFYTYYTGGVRVFDVADPAQPREIAYYHPPPLESTVFRPTPLESGDKQTPAWDSATSVLRYRPASAQLWFVSIAGGFQVVELTGTARPAKAHRRPSCRPARRLVVRLRLRRGERIRRVRARLNGRRTRARRRGRTRVAIDLRPRAQRVQFITIVVRTSRDRRLVLRRRYAPRC